MENYGTNYLNNSFGHEFNENFVENFHQHDQHQPPLQGAMYEYDGIGMASNDHFQSDNQDVNAWNHQDNQAGGYMVFPNYFENQTPIEENMTVNATNSISEQYELPTESLAYINSKSSDLENQIIFPQVDIDNVEAASGSNVQHEKCTAQFTCKDCNKTYATVAGLNNHMKKKHSAAVLFTCDECNATFMTTQQRTVHKIKEHNGRKYQPSRQKNCVRDTDRNRKINETPVNKCQSCDDTFNHKADLVRHMRNRHTGNGEYPCSKCSKVHFTFDMYNEHLSLHDDSIPKHTCTDCGKEFISLRKLKEHSIIHKERIMFKCEMCSKIFVRSQTLQYHRITCKAAYQCSKCVDSFMTAEALEKHISFHKTDTYTCLKCNKVFPTVHALQNHEKRHSLRMNYTCQICKESVSTRAKFQKHIKDHLESNLKCSVCNEDFQSLVKYGYHKAEMHGLMRPYDCLLCSDQFCTRHELFVHLHNHIDVAGTYTCELCGIKFSIKATFEQHKKSHAKGTTEAIAGVSSVVDDFSETKAVDANDKLTDAPLTVANASRKSSSRQDVACTADGCDQTFATQKQLKKHMVVHKLAKYTCPKCTKIYHSKMVYETHVRLCMPRCDDVVLIADEDIDSGPVECGVCGQLFENKKVLKFHQKICNDGSSGDGGGDVSENGGGGGLNQEIEEIYLKTEVEDELDNLVPEF